MQHFLHVPKKTAQNCLKDLLDFVFYCFGFKPRSHVALTGLNLTVAEDDDLELLL